MTNTDRLALIAARVNRGDLVDWCGVPRRVVDYSTTSRPGCVTWKFADGETVTVTLTRTVTIYA